MWRRLRTEGRDALELVLLPGLAAVLPWRWCFALFCRMAHWRWLYQPACDEALAQARSFGLVKNEREWLHERRLVTLADHADYYLSRWRGPRWMRRYLRVEGAWPPSGCSALLCTFHWGGGMWSLHHAAAAGLFVHVLVAPLEGQQFAGRRVLRWYARVRTAEIARASGRMTLDVSRSLRPAVNALNKNEQVMVVIDVPPDQTGVTTAVQVLGRAVWAPVALPRLALQRKLPVTVYSVGLDVRTGERVMRLEHLPMYDDAAALTQRIFDCFDKLIREQPAAWHFWAVAPRFFAEPPQGNSNKSDN